FFSSRRRHTRLQGDWSSDVCSSDLGKLAPPCRALRMVACFGRKVGKKFESLLILESQSRSVCLYPRLELVAICKMKAVQERPLEIGRASCRERGEEWGVDVLVEKKN